MADHQWDHVYFRKFTWCTFCGEFIWGVHKKQGYKCKVCKGCSHPKCRATAGPCPGKDVHKGQNKDRQPRTTLSSWVLPSCVSLRSSVSAPNAHSQRAEDESSGQSSQSHPPQPVNPNHSSPHLPPPEPAHQHSTATLTPAPSKPAPAVEPVKHQARAMFDFPPENSRELELKKGDLVEVLKVDEEWWFGVLANGNEGYFPGNYVEKIGNW